MFARSKKTKNFPKKFETTINQLGTIKKYIKLIDLRFKSFTKKGGHNKNIYIKKIKLQKTKNSLKMLERSFLKMLEEEDRRRNNFMNGFFFYR